MCDNPIFGNYRARMIYAGIWTIIAIVQAVVVYLTATDLRFGYAIVDSVVFNVIFACCIIPLWYPVRFNRWEQRNIAAHVLLAGIVVMPWLVTAFALCYLISMGNTEYRQFLVVSLWWRPLEGLLFYVVAVLVYHLYVHVERLNEKATNEIHLNKLLKDVELNMLKSQINPHFLFNSMNSVNALIMRNPKQAQKMLIALSDYLRYAVLATNRKNSCIEEEMENISRYLSIEKLRFGDKLIYQTDIEPQTLRAEIPAMLLQPLFENAIKHGVYESLETIRITAKITKDSQYLTIKLFNNFDEKYVSHKKGSGTGLMNIREQLRLLYGTSASIMTKSEDSIYTVILRIPLKIIK